MRVYFKLLLVLLFANILLFASDDKSDEIKISKF